MRGVGHRFPLEELGTPKPITAVRQRFLTGAGRAHGRWLECGDATNTGQLQLDSGRLGR